MTDDEVIEILIQQKKEIDQKIREIKRQSSRTGLVKLDRYPYWEKPYYLAVNRWNVDNVKNNGERYMPVIVGSTRNVVVDAIPKLIEELQDIYEKNKVTI